MSGEHAVFVSPHARRSLQLRAALEVFDVQILPGIRYPEVVGFHKDTIQQACVIAPEKPIPPAV